MHRGADLQQVAQQREEVMTTWLAHADKQPPNASQQTLPLQPLHARSVGQALEQRRMLRMRGLGCCLLRKQVLAAELTHCGATERLRDTSRRVRQMRSNSAARGRDVCPAHGLNVFEPTVGETFSVLEDLPRKSDWEQPVVLSLGAEQRGVAGFSADASGVRIG